MFPRSTKEPDLDSRHLQAGCHLGRASGLRPNSSRGPLPSPRFRHRPIDFGTSSVVRLRSSLQISPDRFYLRLFLRRSPPTLLTPAARSGLEPAPDHRLQGAYPHLSCSSIPPNVVGVLAAHVVAQFEGLVQIRQVIGVPGFSLVHSWFLHSSPPRCRVMTLPFADFSMSAANSLPTHFENSALHRMSGSSALRNSRSSSANATV